MSKKKDTDLSSLLGGAQNANALRGTEPQQVKEYTNVSLVKDLHKALKLRALTNERELRDELEAILRPILLPDTVEK